MLLATLLLLFSASSSASDLPPGEGKAIVERTCVSCHALKVVTAKRASKEQWSTLVDQMISRGADLSDDEAEIVVDYLAKNFGPAKEPDGGEKNHTQSGSMNTEPEYEPDFQRSIRVQRAESKSKYQSQRMAQFVEGARD